MRWMPVGVLQGPEHDLRGDVVREIADQGKVFPCEKPREVHLEKVSLDDPSLQRGEVSQQVFYRFGVDLGRQDMAPLFQQAFGQDTHPGAYFQHIAVGGAIHRIGYAPRDGSVGEEMLPEGFFGSYFFHRVSCFFVRPAPRTCRRGSGHSPVEAILCRLSSCRRKVR